MNINQRSYDIHVFGDSHCRLYGSPYLSFYSCNVYYVGPMTMHRVGRDNMRLAELQNASKRFYETYLKTATPEYSHMTYPENDVIKDDDLVIYVFGEIDIRAHLVRQLDKGRNEFEVLNELASRYISTVKSNQNEYKHVKFGVQSITPPTDEKKMEESGEEYPVYGDLETRMKCTHTINKMLKQMCEENNILFLDTHSYYKNDDTSYPKPGLCRESKLNELDYRIKDKSVHVHISNPEGIEHVFSELNIPPNINYKLYKNEKCKYPSGLNVFQRDLYIRLRIAHYVIFGFMAFLLFLPNKYFIVAIFFWSFVLIMNFIISSGRCSLSILEFQLSHCNENNLFDEIGIPQEFQKLVWIFLYSTGIMVIFVRGYYYFHNKNLFNIKYINLIKKLK